MRSLTEQCMQVMGDKGKAAGVEPMAYTLGYMQGFVEHMEITIPEVHQQLKEFLDSHQSRDTAKEDLTS